MITQRPQRRTSSLRATRRVAQTGTRIDSLCSFPEMPHCLAAHGILESITLVASMWFERGYIGLSSLHGENANLDPCTQTPRRQDKYQRLPATKHPRTSCSVEGDNENCGLGATVLSVLSVRNQGVVAHWSRLKVRRMVASWIIAMLDIRRRSGARSPTSPLPQLVTSYTWYLYTYGDGSFDEVS